MSRYTVWDRAMVLERLAGCFLCPVIGHRWKRKMHGSICKHCRTFRPI